MPTQDIQVAHVAQALQSGPKIFAWHLGLEQLRRNRVSDSQVWTELGVSIKIPAECRHGTRCARCTNS